MPCVCVHTCTPMHGTVLHWVESELLRVRPLYFWLRAGFAFNLSAEKLLGRSQAEVPIVCSKMIMPRSCHALQDGASCSSSRDFWKH